MPLISIIVPIYGVEEYLDRCVQSVLVQTYKNIEIILVDDGSPDHCPQMCDEYALKDARIKVIHKQNGGLSSARNAGMERMSGEYFMFVDGDDQIMPETTEVLYNRLIETNTDLAVCGRIDHYRTYDKRVSYDNLVYEGRDNVIIAFLKNDIPPTACAKMYKTEKYGILRFEEGIIHEDNEFLSRLLLNTDRVSLCSYVGYIYCLRTGSIMQSRFSHKNFDAAYIAQKIQVLYTKENIDCAKELQKYTMESYLTVLDRAIISGEYSNYKQACDLLTDWIKQNIKDILLNDLIRFKHKLGALVFAMDNDYLLNLLAKYLIKKQSSV